MRSYSVLRPMTHSSHWHQRKYLWTPQQEPEWDDLLDIFYSSSHLLLNFHRQLLHSIRWVFIGDHRFWTHRHNFLGILHNIFFSILFSATTFIRLYPHTNFFIRASTNLLLLAIFLLIIIFSAFPAGYASGTSLADESGPRCPNRPFKNDPIGERNIR